MGTAWVEVQPDFSPLNRKLAELRAKDVTIEVKADVDRRSLAEAEARTKALGGEEQVDVKANVDRTSFAHARASTGGLASDVNRLGISLGKTNRNFSFLGSAIKLIKWPAIITGAGQAAGALGAAGGGAAALSGALAPGIGLVTQYGTALGVLGQVKAVTALSGISNLKLALGGLDTKLNKSTAAWKKLSPEAQRFAEELQRLKAPIRELQAHVQRPLFAGLEKGLHSAIRNLPVFQDVLGGTSAVLGDLAQRFGSFLGSKGFGRDFRKIGETNNAVLERMGKAGINVAHVLTDIMVAARPLTNWISKLALGWTENLKGVVQTAREGGQLTHFFEQTREVTSRLLSIIGSLGSALWNIISLGKPLGDSILKSLDRSAAAFNRWTESARGRNAIAQYFKDIKPPLFEMGRLVRDVVKSFFTLSRQSGLTNIIRELRTQLLPALVSTVKSTSAAFGPHLVSLLSHVAEIFAKLAGSSGPLTLYVDLLDKATVVVNKILGSVPGLKSGIVTLIGFAGVIKAIKFTAAISGITSLIGLFGRLRTAAAGAAAAETAANTAGGFGGVVSSAGKAEGVLATLGRSAGLVGAGMIAAGAAGALLGRGLRSLIGPAQHVVTWQGHMKRGANALHDALKRQADVTRIASRASDRHAAAQRRAHRASANLKDAEHALQRARDKYPANSDQVVRAELRVKRAKNDDRRATQDLKNAERLHGVELQLAKRTYHSTVLIEKNRISDLKDERARLLDAARAAIKHHASQERLNVLQKKLSATDSELDKTQGQLTHTYQLATKQVGGKFAAGLKGASATLELLQRNTQKQTTLLTPFQNQVQQSTKKTRKLGDASQDTGQRGGQAYDHLQRVAGQGLLKLGQNTNNALKALGVNKVNFNIAVSKVGAAVLKGAGKQQGGAVGFDVPGPMAGDKVPISIGGVPVAVTEGKERLFVLNARASEKQRDLEEWNKRFPRFGFQRGGILDRTGVPHLAGGGFAGMQPAIVSLAKTFISKFGGVMSSGFRPGDPGFHGRGMAADIVPRDWSGASRYANQIGSQLLEGIHAAPPGSNVSWDSGHQVPSSFWGGATWAAHHSHIHLAAAQMIKGAAGAMAKEIKRVLLKGPRGALTDMGQAALDKVRAAANRYIAKHTPQGGVGAELLSGDGNVERVFASIAKKASTSKTATLALGEAGFAESGMRDLSYGDSTSTGALQLLASTAAAMHINPHDEGQIASAFLLRGFYGKGGANKLAAQGLPAHLVAQNVQGSATPSGSNYAAQLANAQSWMKRFGLKRGGVIDLWGKGIAHLAKGGGGQVTTKDIQSGLDKLTIANLIRLEHERGAAPSIHRAAFKELLDRVHVAEKGVPIKPFGRLHDLTERLQVLELTQKLHPKSKRPQRAIESFLDENAPYLVSALKYRKKEHRELLLKQKIASHTPGTEDDERIKALLNKFLGKKPKKPGLSDQFAITKQFFDFLKLLGPGSQLGQFAGQFGDGGLLRGGEWGIAGERGRAELVTGPARVHPPAETASLLSPNVEVNVYGSILSDREDPVELVIGDRRFRAKVNEIGEERRRGLEHRRRTGVSPTQ